VRWGYVEKRKFYVCITGTVGIDLLAESEEQAEKLIDAVRSRDKKPEEVGISEEIAEMLDSMSEIVLDVYEQE
jgi:hypothetical protein